MRCDVLTFSALLLTVLSAAAMGDELGVFKPPRPSLSDYLRLQDFCIFRHAGQTYVAAMKKDLCREGIIVARSSDLKDWQVLGDAVSTRTEEDRSMVWAPHVVEDSGVYYMFYTGVTTPAKGQWCQRILVATTADPSKPANWQRNNEVRFVVDGKEQSWFRPDHPGAVWSASAWADCRDPMVLRHGDIWHMFYSGTDKDGGIMGVATAPSLTGPWQDRGAALKVGAGIPESCFVLQAPDGSFVMTFNHAGVGGSKSARSKSLLPKEGAPPFSDIRLLSDTTGAPLLGWAHEFLPVRGKKLLCANLTGYFVSFKDTYFRREAYGWTICEQQ